ncbi:MAG TPA: hypothetical protein VGJ21_01790, partial [Terracidiphilus sp.]
GLHSFRGDRPMTLDDQGSFWFFTTFLLPCILYFTVLFTFWMGMMFSGSFEVAARGTRFIGTINSAYAAYVCWDSIVAIAVCTAVYIVVYLVLSSGASKPATHGRY